MGRKGSEVSPTPSKRYPLRSTHSSGRDLRSASNKNTTACDERLNDSAADQPAARKRKSGSLSGSLNNSVRVLRSSSKNKDEARSESLSGNTAGEQAANVRKNVTPSKVASPNNSVRVLRSASKNRDEACSEPLNGSTSGEQAANGRKHVATSKVGSLNNSVRVLRSASKNEYEASNKPLNGNIAGEQDANGRKCVTPSKVGSPNSSVRVLRSASKNKNEAYSEPLNDNTAAQPSAKKRKSGSPLKVGSPVRVLHSNSKRTNEALDEPINDGTAAQRASRKRKTDMSTMGGSPKLGVGVLASASQKDTYVLALCVPTPIQPAARKTKSITSTKERSPKKDYQKICQRVRYVLNRMNYEQSLIQAYAGEGWKGQSLEKIRPEKELERAKAEILRCKIKIREAFRNMDSLLSKGKLEESLFNSSGEIFSEYIFCAICGSKDVTLQDDIILCDGACDRGFHQNCLNPPLLTEDIPPGDEGWFCPACVCKLDCVDALNEFQGSKLSVHDSWEKVFPEAVSFANGSKQLDASDLPLCDSENNDYNPSLVKGHIGNEGRSSAQHDVDDLGLPSEDSEDDDFDPAVSDSSEDQKGKLESEESDFTSDSDDFCTEIAKSVGQGGNTVNEENWNRAFTEMERDQDVLPIPSRRQVERFDYKKLYDEAYGEESSSSTDDEEWSGKEKLEDSETDGSIRSAKRSSRRASAGTPISQHTPQSEHHCASVNEQQTEVLRSNGSNSASRRFDPIIKQKLKDHFEKEPYPSRATKENLARELELTFIQVDKWFASTRHSSRVAAAKKGKCTGNHTTENNDGTVDSTQMRAPSGAVLPELTADRNDMVHDKLRVQNNLDGRNKEDIPLPRSQTETEAYEKELSDPSYDKEWFGTSASQKEDIETDSLAASNRAEHLAKRAPVEPQNKKHNPLSKQLQGSVNENLVEAPFSNGSSSRARKHHFDPIVNQKLKEHFEKDPFPSRSTVQCLAQELGLTFIQVRRWFNSTRHYSRVSAAKSRKDSENRINEKNDSTTVGNIQGKDGNHGVMENPNEDTNDMVSRKFMLQINLNEDNNDDIMLSQHPSCEETIITTPTAISRELGPLGYGPGENQDKSVLWNTGFEQGLNTTPTTVSRDTPPGYGPGESQGFCESQNTISEQRNLMTPTTTTMPISEVGPPGFGPGENQGNSAAWNTSSEHRAFVTPTTSSREACPPRYGSGLGQVNGASWNSISEQRVNTAPSTISSSVSLPGYGSGVHQVPGASWNTSTEQREIMTPSTIPIEVSPSGYWPGDYQGSAFWNTSSDQSAFVTSTTSSREACPLGYGSGVGQVDGASWNSISEQRVNTAPSTISSSVGPPGYGTGVNQVHGASWNTSTEQFGPSGYWLGDYQGNGASWNNRCEESLFVTPTTTVSEVGPPGYWPQQNEGNGAGASMNAGSSKGGSAEKPDLADDERKKAIARELRRMKKYR